MAFEPLISDGCWDKVSVSDIQEEGDFTVKLAGTESEFIAMMGRLQISSSSSRPPANTPSVGTLLNAQFSFDNQWYRARLQKVNADGSLEVRYIDYGNKEQVNISNTRIASTSDEMPSQGIDCRLNRIDYSKPIDRVHHEAFRSMCLNQTFTACFVTKSTRYNSWNIELFHPTGNVNDWFGKRTGRLTAPLSSSDIPARLPHPNNFGLIATPAGAAAPSPAASPVRPTNTKLQKRSVPSLFDGTVVFANNPSEFWLQMETDTDAVMNIGAELAAYCNSADCAPLTSPAVGQLCTALYSEDGTWYRGQIVELHPSGGAKVFFIDYGNTELVDASSISIMPVSLQKEPGFAIEACLNGVTSVGTIWSEEATGAFSEIVMVDACRVDVIGTVKSHTKLVNLSLNGSSVGAQLVQGGYAKAAQAQVSAPSPAMPTARPTPPRASTVHVGYKRQQVESGQREMVYVSWLYHPGAFWVQKAGCEDLLASLLDSVKECSTESAPMSNPVVGDACIALYSEDGNWYRGEIERCGDQSCTVLFIDYGNSEDISKHHIYPASSSLLEIPCQAFKCTILGISPSPGADWSSESHDKMEELLAEGGMCTFLAKKDDAFLVEMTFNGEASLQEALVQAGVAKLTRTSSQRSHSSQGSHRSGASVSSVSKYANRGSPSQPPLPQQHRVDAGGDRQTTVPRIKPATAENLGIERTVEGCIVFMTDNCRKVYVQLSKNKAAIDDMYNKMGEMAHGNQAQQVEKVSVGDFLLVKFKEDGEWYRCEVLKEDNGKYEVFYVDYGNSEKDITRDDLRILDKKFYAMPAQAVCCSLHNFNKDFTEEQLKTVKSTYTFADVTGEVKSTSGGELVVDLLCNGERLCSIIESAASSVASTPARPGKPLTFPPKTPSSGEFKAWLVHEESQDLFYIQKSEDSDLLNTVAETVISEVSGGAHISNPVVGQATLAKFQDDEQWYRAEITAVNDDNVDVIFVDYGNSSSVAKSDILEISETFVQTPKLAEPCKLAATAADKSLTDWATDELDVKVLSTTGGIANVTLAKAAGEFFSVVSPDAAAQQDVPLVTPIAKKFPRNQITVEEFDGFLTFEASQSEFYIQKTLDTERIGQVTNNVHTQAETNPVLAQPIVGQACLAKFADDETWYRAEILANDNPEHVEVMFVDFGNCSQVPRHDLREIDEELAQCPPLAVCCKVCAPVPDRSLTDFCEEEVKVSVQAVDGQSAIVNITNGSGDSFALVEEAGQKAETKASVYRIAKPDISVEQFKGYISFDVSQQEFYVQRTSHTDLLAEVAEKVEVESSNQPLTTAEVGQACVARFKGEEGDCGWYRAEVTAVPETGPVQVYFVDFGNKASVAGNDIVEISEELSQIPAMAIPCRMVSESSEKSLADWAADELTIAVIQCLSGVALVTLTSSDGESFSTPLTNGVSGSATPERTVEATPPYMNGSADLHSSAASSPARPVLFHIQKAQVTPGQHKAYVSHLEDADCIYLQLSSSTDMLNEILEKLDENGPKAEPEAYCPVGQACISVYSADNNWYRAVVVKSYEDTGTSSVLFVDYGTMETVTNSSLKVLPKCLRDQPQLAFKCNSKQESILKMPKECFAEQVNSKELTVIIEGDNEPYSILIPELDDVDMSASSQLISNTHVDTATFKYAIPDIQTSQDDVVLAVSHIVDPSSFYCQFSTGELLRIEALLSHLYSESHLGFQLAQEDCNPGVACVVLKGEQYYRARMESKLVNDPDSYQVLLVDYGITDVFPSTSLLHLHLDCSEPAAQALPCSLSGVHPLCGKSWDDDAISRFYELVNKTELQGRVISVTTDKDTPELLVSLTCSGESVTETLVTAGFCSEVPVAEKPIADFCKDLCEEIKKNMLLSTNNQITLLADKLSEFVNRLNGVLKEQLITITEDIQSTCTAQDLVYYISHKTLCELLDKTFKPDIVPSMSRKNTMVIEVQSIIGELLEEVMRVNSAIVDHMCDDGMLAMDNLSKVTSHLEDTPHAHQPSADINPVSVSDVAAEQADSVLDNTEQTQPQQDATEQEQPTEEAPEMSSPDDADVTDTDVKSAEMDEVADQPSMAEVQATQVDGGTSEDNLTQNSAEEKAEQTSQDESTSDLKDEELGMSGETGSDVDVLENDDSSAEQQAPEVSEELTQDDSREVTTLNSDGGEQN